MTLIERLLKMVKTMNWMETMLNYLFRIKIEYFYNQFKVSLLIIVLKNTVLLVVIIV
jgi:hypothetical protein